MHIDVPAHESAPCSADTLVQVDELFGSCDTSASLLLSVATHRLSAGQSSE